VKLKTLATREEALRSPEELVARLGKDRCGKSQDAVI
jgi:hypothetical protein